MVNSTALNKLPRESESRMGAATPAFLFEEDEPHFIRSLRQHSILSAADVTKLSLPAIGANRVVRYPVDSKPRNGF